MDTKTKYKIKPTNIFCSPPSMYICLYCRMLMDYVHRIYDTTSHLYMSMSTPQKNVCRFQYYQEIILNLFRF